MPPAPRITFGDFAEQVRRLRRTGPFSEFLKKLPEPVRELADGLDMAEAEAELDRVEALAAVLSPDELRDPQLSPDSARLRRLALHADLAYADVKDLFEQFDEARRMMDEGEFPDLG